MTGFVAAAVQMQSGPDMDRNLDRARALVHQAVARGATFVVLPEVFAWRGAKSDEAANATALPGPVSEFLCGLAKELGITLVGGSFLERVADETRLCNTSLLIDPDGAIRGVYRKIHLFDVDLPGQVTVRESDGRRPGAETVAVATRIGMVGMSICYDLRFPELYRRLVRAGAVVVTVPSAFTFVTGSAHWEVLLRARAIENQVYVIAPDQTGTSPHGFRDYGNSMIVDPWGTVIARAADGEQVVIADVDLDRVARVRGEMPCLQHARLLG